MRLLKIDYVTRSAAPEQPKQRAFGMFSNKRGNQRQIGDQKNRNTNKLEDSE